MRKWHTIFLGMKKNLPLGERIKTLRKQRGLTQEALAEKIGCTQETVVYYEHNKKHPSVEKIPLLAQALGVSINDLFGDAPQTDALKVKNPKLWKKFEKVETLPENDRRIISKMLDAFLAQKLATR